MRYLLIHLFALCATLCCSAAGQSVVVETQAGGELAGRLGDDLLTVEELTVRGPVNAADFHTMWQMTSNGSLENLNLSGADVEGKIIPAYAFYNGGFREGGTLQAGYAKLKSVILPDDIVEIGEAAFRLAVNLGSVNIPKSVRSIGARAFSECFSLCPETLILPEGLVSIGQSCFAECVKLSRVEFPAGLETIGSRAFRHSGIEEAELPDGLRNLASEAFAQCNRLTKVSLPRSGMTFIGSGAFSEAMCLEKLDIPDGITTLQAEVVNECLSLRELDIPSAVTEIGDRALYGCRALKAVVLPDNLTKIGYRAFRGCSNVASLDIPASVVSMKNGCFDLMGSLKRISCRASVPPAWDIVNPSYSIFDGSEESAMRATPKDIPVYIPVGTKSLYQSAPGWSDFTNYIETDNFPSADVAVVEPEYAVIQTERGAQLAEKLGERIYAIDSLVVKGPFNEDDEVTLRIATREGRLRVWNLSEAEIENKMFGGEAYSIRDGWLSRENPPYYALIPVRRVMLPDDIEVIGNGAFFSCAYLEEINIPKSVREIGSRAFFECLSLGRKGLTLPEGLERIYEECFARCESLREINLPSSLKRIDELAFYESGLERVNFSEGLEYIGQNAFTRCQYLKEISLPNSCQTFEGRYHFVMDYSLERICLPKGLKAVPQHFAWQCKSLREVDVPESLEVLGASAFEQCTALQKVQLPEGLRVIETAAFDRCVNIRRLILPSSLEQIGGAFDDMPGLKEIYCKAAVPPVQAFVGSESWIWPMSLATGRSYYQVDADYSTPRDIPVYVPRGSAEAYRDAPGWNYFTNFIETDEFPDASVDEAVMPESAVEVSVESGRILLVGNEGAASDYAVYTVDGRLVASGSADGGTATIDVAPGLYIVALGTKTAKVAVP